MSWTGILTCYYHKKTAAPKLWAAQLLIIGIALMTTRPTATAQEVPPVLEFPQSGLDDPATYRGYTTRFFRDSAGNTVQVYLNQNNGRVVHLWADAANESLSFTVRDSAGQPARLKWDSPGARVTSERETRYVEYSLRSATTQLDLGHFVLNTMRLERDFQYFKKHLQPFDSEPFIPKELPELINNLKRLPEDVRRRHLALLNAESLEELRHRLLPKIDRRSTSGVLVAHPTFDGNNHLSLELKVDGAQATIDVSKDRISIHSLGGQPIRLTVRVGTDAPALTPLSRGDIFNSDFFRFYERAKAKHDSLLRSSGTTGKDIGKDERVLRFKRLQRQVKSMELLSSQEKLMAGLPNFATYFGRDMMMSALMLEPVLKPAMLEHVIASVLRKLTPTGEVSHEEGLGGQAIRENAAKYNQLIAGYIQQKTKKTDAAANKILAEAEQVLSNLQAITENYHMVDDDFQLPVLAARYLTNSTISNDRKRKFLQSAIRPGDETTRLTLLLRNLNYVSKVSRSYVENPVADNLVSFRKLGEHRWHAGSWRDSAVGYANGRFAMDINAIWVPNALASIEKILTTLRQIGISIEALQTSAPEIRSTKLVEYAHHPEALRQAVTTWRNAVRHFEVHLSAQEVQRRVRAKLDWFPEAERTYWHKVIANSGADQKGVEFLALSLDEKGQPIPVANTDVATWLFLDDLTKAALKGEIRPEEIVNRLRVFVTPYPVGLLLEGVGAVVANDAYASATVWENFRRDIYHSPRVIWGREVNLLFLGLAKQIAAAYDAQGRIKDAGLDSYVQELRWILDKTLAAVEASGLKHNELWSYRIDGETLLPARYATTSDIQLWNLTNLAVQFLLDRL